MTDRRNDPAVQRPEFAAAPPPRTKKKRGFRVWFSYLLFIVAAALFVGVVGVYLHDRREDNSNPVPTVEAGSYRLIDVQEALKAQGLSVDFGKGANLASGVSQVAQLLTVNNETVYVFIYPDPAERESDQKSVESSKNLIIENTLRTPIASDPPYVFGGSNIMVAVYTDDSGLRDKIQKAIEGMGS